MSSKSTLSDLLIAFLFLVCAASGFVVGWNAQNWIAIIITGLLGVWMTTFILTALRKGLRPQTKLERYEMWALILLVAVGFGGLVLLIAYWRWLLTFAPIAPQVIKIVLVAVPTVIWLVATFAIGSRVRGRHETASAYSRRIGIREDES